MLINQNYPEIVAAHQQSIMSRSETQIKRNKRKPSQPLMMCGLLNSRVRHQEVPPVVLVKKKRFREKETIRQWKKKREKRRFSSFGRRDWQADSEGRAEKRKCFHLPSCFFLAFPSFSISILPYLSLFPLLLLSLRNCSLRQELAWQGCLFLMFDISPCAARLKEHTRMNAPRFSKEHLVISQRFPILTHSALR